VLLDTKVLELVSRTRSTYEGPLEVEEDLLRFTLGGRVVAKNWNPQLRRYPDYSCRDKGQNRRLRRARTNVRSTRDTDGNGLCIVQLGAINGPEHLQQGVLIEAPLLDHGIAPR
jgi:hypothetical protein